MNKKMLPILLLAMLLCLFLTACSPASQTPVPTQTTESTQSPAPTQTPKPTQTPAPTQSAKPTQTPKPRQTPKPTPALPDEDGSYTHKDDVALYIHTYGHLPPNFIKKKEAEALGWNGGSLEWVLPGMCIGGDYFGNYEGLLPKAKGRRWTECDIDTLGARSRGSKRIVFSNDGLIYYSPDHYETFELLYDDRDP